jgi:hypothetical protein
MNQDPTAGSSMRPQAFAPAALCAGAGYRWRAASRGLCDGTPRLFEADHWGDRRTVATWSFLPVVALLKPGRHQAGSSFVDLL